MGSIELCACGLARPEMTIGSMHNLLMHWNLVEMCAMLCESERRRGMVLPVQRTDGQSRCKAASNRTPTSQAICDQC